MRFDIELTEPARVEVSWTTDVYSDELDRLAYVEWRKDGAPYFSFGYDSSGSYLGEVAMTLEGAVARADPQRILSSAARAERLSNGVACAIEPLPETPVGTTPCQFLTALEGPHGWWSAVILEAPPGHHSAIVVVGSSQPIEATHFEIDVEGPAQPAWSFVPSRLITHRDMEDTGYHASARALGVGGIASLGASAAFHVEGVLYGFASHRTPNGFSTGTFVVEGPAGTREVDDFLLFQGDPPGDYRASLTAVDVGEWGRYGVLVADFAERLP